MLKRQHKRTMALFAGVLSLASCGYDTQNFECADLDNKAYVVSFSKKSNSAVFSSVEMQFCKKDGNMTSYTNTQEGCKNFSELRKVGGTWLGFDDVVFTLEEKSFVGNVFVLKSYKCKKLPN